MLDIRDHKREYAIGKLGGAVVEVNARVTEVVGLMNSNFGEVEEKMEELEEKCEEAKNEAEELRESWVAAEEDLKVLMKKVEHQDRTIQRLERQVTRALDLIRDLTSAVLPGELSHPFY